MKSPFPGMDPFLEHPAFWSDFHFNFINYWREAVADTLPPHYEATLGERVYLVEHDPEMRKLGFPDAAVTHDDLSSSTPPGFSSGTATLEPVTIPLAILEGPRETYIFWYRTASGGRIARYIAGRSATRYQPCPSRCAPPDPDIFVDLARYSPPRMARTVLPADQLPGTHTCGCKQTGSRLG